jgi:hypothetical protein
MTETFNMNWRIQKFSPKFWTVIRDRRFNVTEQNIKHVCEIVEWISLMILRMSGIVFNSVNTVGVCVSGKKLIIEIYY